MISVGTKPTIETNNLYGTGSDENDENIKITKDRLK
jgi:hypothetical protein